MRDLLCAYLLRYYTEDAAGQNIQVAPFSAYSTAANATLSLTPSTDNVYWDITPRQNSQCQLNKIHRVVATLVRPLENMEKEVQHHSDDLLSAEMT